MKLTVPTAIALLAVTTQVQAQQSIHRLDTLRVSVGSRVSAELPAATRAVEVIRADELLRQPGQSIQDILARALSADVSARSPAQADIALRGGTFEQVLVLVDGARVSDTQTGHFDLSLAVPIEEIERIEILRGPASAVYGADALGGVINIVTRRHDNASMHARLEGGSFETMSVAAGGQVAGPRLQIGGTGDYRRSDGHRTGTDYRIASGHLAVQMPLGDRTLRATFGAADRDFGASKFYTAPESNYDEFERTRLLSAQVAWEAQRDARFTIEPRLSVRRHDDDFVLRRNDPDFYRNVHRTWQFGSEVVARYAGERARAVAGGEGYRDVLRSSSLGDREESRGALFTEIGAGTTGRIVGTTGVRVDWHSAYGSFVAPSAAGAVWLTPATRVRASASRAFRAPTWTDRYYSDPANLGNPDLDPEKAWEGELGLDVQAGSVRAELSGYVRRTESLIDWARPEGSEPTAPWQIMNVTEATFRGVELAIHDIEAFGARLTARVSGIAFDAEANGYNSKYALRPLTRQASLDIERTIAGTNLFVRAAHARRAGESGYTTVDARLSREIRAVRFYIDVLNATDQRYLDVSRMGAAGRSVYAGFGWNGGL